MICYMSHLHQRTLFIFNSFIKDKMINCIKSTVLLTLIVARVTTIHTHGYSPYDTKYPFEHLNSNLSSETQSAQLDESKFREEDVVSDENRTISDLVDVGCNCGVPHNAAYKLTNETEEENLEAESVIDGLQSGVLGGEVISRDQFPWTVRIVFVCMSKERRKFSKWTLCSGSVISPRLVASSAHCFSQQMNTNTRNRNCLKNKDGTPVGRIMVDIGINSSELKRKSDLHDIEKVLTPDEEEIFNSVNDLNSHDFALALLKQQLDLSGKIRSICLPKLNEEFDGKMATSLGWGIYEVYGKEVKLQHLLDIYLL